MAKAINNGIVYDDLDDYTYQNPVGGREESALRLAAVFDYDGAFDRYYDPEDPVYEDEHDYLLCEFERAFGQAYKFAESITIDEDGEATYHIRSYCDECDDIILSTADAKLTIVIDGKPRVWIVSDEYASFAREMAANGGRKKRPETRCLTPEEFEAKYNRPYNPFDPCFCFDQVIVND